MYQVNEFNSKNEVVGTRYYVNLSAAEDYMSSLRGRNTTHCLLKDNVEIKRYAPQDRCSQIIENLKFFLYNLGDPDIIVRNEFGFSHDTQFVSWVGDGHSFIITDGTGEYRIQISKEIE